MENKNVEIKTETSLVTLPKMEFVFDSAKITPAKIDKDMIDFEKAEQKVEEIEKLYNVVFTDVKDIKKYREEVASTKSSAEKFKKDLMDYLTADTKEINQKLINLIKRVDAVRKYLHDKEKELDNAKREKIKSIKELIFKDRPEYLVYLVENKKWENKTFKEINIEAEIQQQYDELIKKENFIKQEIEKANKEIKFKIVFESMKYLIQEDYTVISKAINDKMNEIKQTEENLRIRAEEEKQKEIAELERKREIEKQEAIAKALQEKEQKETDNKKGDTYICIKVNGLSKEIALELKGFLDKNNIKYFTIMDKIDIKYAILYIPNDFNQENFKEIQDIAEVIKLTSPYKFVSREFKKADTIIDVKGHLIGGDNFMLMAGPCSVENREMLSNIAKEVKKGGAVVLRGGAYKPRTSPYDFQGLGEVGLKYLREVADENDMLVVTELMDSDDLNLVSSYADIIQIGARNMQNFSLLKKLGKLDKPVLLKRGLSATINEFLLSAEYILAHGNQNVILCERGIRTFETMTRNTLDLNAIALVRELSHLPIIVDASHGTGKRSLVGPLTLAGIMAGANGAMIEVHENPDCALSDGPQSLDFKLFDKVANNIRKSLYFRKDLE